MSWFETKKKELTKVKVKKRKVTVKDIQIHIKWLDDEMSKVQEERRRYREIMKQMTELDPITNKKEYDKLELEARLYADADDRYTQLQEQKEKEYTILKKYKDSRFYIQPKDLAIILGVSALSVFMISLERENPKSLKLASYVLKLFPIKI